MAKKLPINGNKKANKSNVFIWTLLSLVIFNIVYFLASSINDNNKLNYDDKNDFVPVGEHIHNMEYNPMNIAGFVFSSKESTPDLACDKILHDDQSIIEVTPPIDLNKPTDLKTFRDQLKSRSSENNVYELFFQDKEDELEESILKDKWYKFCGSAIWLEKYGVYFMVNRIAYSFDKRRNHPTISVLAGQVFDKNWDEIYGMQFPFSNLTFPTVLPHYIDVGTQKKKDILGSEDPRIIMHRYTNIDGVEIQEPLIVFNALSQEVNWKRAMHIYRPLYDANATIRLDIEGLEPRNKEKNWMPFDTTEDHIHFIYSFRLRVIRCELATGKCHKISGPDFNDKSNAGILRGGTNLIEIPTKYVPEELKSRKFWLGIGRSHIKNCGCVNELYRPHAIIISRENEDGDGQYSLNYVSDLFDFNINPEPWTSGKTTCSDGKLVLIPNSVAYFNDDHLGVTVSEADRTNKLVHTRGWLSYIQKILNELKFTLNDENRDFIVDGNRLSECSTFFSGKYCDASKNSMGWDRKLV